MAVDKVQRKEKTQKITDVFTQTTLRVLEKLKKNEIIGDIKAPVFQGKESIVYVSNSKQGLLAIKIYRIENCDFKAMFDYLKRDPRTYRIAKQKRKVTLTWAEREFKNMQKAWESNISMPKPILQKFNILIMSYLGYFDEETDSFNHAPKLKDLDLDEDGWIDLATKTLKYLKNIYDNGLVHGDLSEYNILYYNGEPYFIDFSHGTVRQNCDYQVLYERDKANVLSFFKRKIGLKINDIATKIKLV